jgi:hypothetical protein
MGFLIFLFVLVVISLCIAIDTVRLGISPMPSSRKAQRVLLSLVEKGTVYELGSGWGTLAAILSKNNRVRAFERALIPWLVSLLQKRIRGAKNLSIERRDFFLEDLSGADVVICYLYPAAMQRLGPKFEKELKAGAIVLSNSFQLVGRKPDTTIEVRDWMGSKIYCYRFG